MPKRSAQEKLDRYKRKIQKLEEEQRNLELQLYTQGDEQDEIFMDTTQAEPVDIPAQETAAEAPDIGQDVSVEPAASEEPELLPEAPKTADSEATELVLNPEILQALGESTEESPEYGEKILDNLANLWLPLLKKGMPQDAKEKMLKEYLIPDNCRLLQAPKLNAEITSAIPDMVRNRDKNLVMFQQQLGLGITAINRATELLLKGDEKIQAIKHLSNGCRILCDLHSASTKNRIKLLTPSLDKNILHVIQETERDETIFGDKLSDKLKAAKAIERQGLQIKKTQPKTSTFVQSTNFRAPSSGNWPAPPRYPSYRGGRGGSRRPSTSNRRPYTSSQTARTFAPSKPRAPTAQ